jgi:hypothetical protein
MPAYAERVARQQGSPRIALGTSELQTAAILLYRAAGYQLVREEIAATATNRTVGSDLRRYHFEKQIIDGLDLVPGASSPS